MLLSERKSLPTTGQWHYEIKYDGYRMLASTAVPALRTRGGADATRWFPEILLAIGTLPQGDFVLDGEVCILDTHGRSDFDALHDRARRRGWRPGDREAVYCVFDLLSDGGEDIRHHPIEQRKARLAELIGDRDRGLLYVDHMDDGAVLFQFALAAQLEGITAKRARSAYAGGRSADWLKIKRPGAIPPGRFHRAI
ncbi:ATP-dependent DNA ligase [Paracidovorax citrulli]